VLPKSFYQNKFTRKFQTQKRPKLQILDPKGPSHFSITTKPECLWTLPPSWAEVWIREGSWEPGDSHPGKKVQFVIKLARHSNTFLIPFSTDKKKPDGENAPKKKKIAKGCPFYSYQQLQKFSDHVLVSQHLLCKICMGDYRVTDI